jgi:hypothetical protein
MLNIGDEASMSGNGVVVEMDEGALGADVELHHLARRQFSLIWMTLRRLSVSLGSLPKRSISSAAKRLDLGGALELVHPAVEAHAQVEVGT